MAQKRREKKGLDLLACSFGGQALKTGLGSFKLFKFFNAYTKC